MREGLLELLAEPETGSPLRVEVDRHQKGRIEEGCLISEKTGQRFPIVRGIPRFVEGTTYTDSFGMQWNRFRDVQVDADTGGSHSTDRFDTETEWDKDTLKGKRVLDAGCGAGRFAEVAAARGAELVAIDYSSAIDATARTLGAYPNVDLVQGSILAPPFRKGVFDFAYCIGVVQHTPSPEGAVGEVVKLVRPGGSFCFTIYARQPWTKLNAKYLWRPITRRLPQEMLLKAIQTVMPIAFPVTDRLFRLPVLGRMAQFTIPIANYDRGDFTREQRYDEAILDTFDMLAPRYDSPMTAREVEAVLRGLSARSWRFNTEVPINVIGER